MQPLHPLLSLLLGVLILPISGGALGAWFSRRAPWRGTALGLTAGVALGLTLGQGVMVGWPHWPAGLASDWLCFSAWFAVLLTSAVPRGTRDWSDPRGIVIRATLGLLASAAWTGLVYGSGANLIPVVFSAPMLEQLLSPMWWLPLMTLLTWSLWVTLDGLLGRQSAWAGLATLSGLGTATAALLVLGRTVMVAQLVGAATVALGGASVTIAWLARRQGDAGAVTPVASTRGSLRPLALPAAWIMSTALTQARHYAYLPTVAWLWLATALMLAWVVVTTGQRSSARAPVRERRRPGLSGGPSPTQLRVAGLVLGLASLGWMSVELVMAVLPESRSVKSSVKKSSTKDRGSPGKSGNSGVSGGAGGAGAAGGGEDDGEDEDYEYGYE